MLVFRWIFSGVLGATEIVSVAGGRADQMLCLESSLQLGNNQGGDEPRWSLNSDGGSRPREQGTDSSEVPEVESRGLGLLE